MAMTDEAEQRTDAGSMQAFVLGYLSGTLTSENCPLTRPVALVDMDSFTGVSHVRLASGMLVTLTVEVSEA
jgi:hypothetical protein